MIDLENEGQKIMKNLPYLRARSLYKEKEKAFFLQEAAVHFNQLRQQKTHVWQRYFWQLASFSFAAVLIFFFAVFGFNQNQIAPLEEEKALKSPEKSFGLEEGLVYTGGLETKSAPNVDLINALDTLSRLEESEIEITEEKADFSIWMRLEGVVRASSIIVKEDPVYQLDVLGQSPIILDSSEINFKNFEGKIVEVEGPLSVSQSGLRSIRVEKIRIKDPRIKD